MVPYDLPKIHINSDKKFTSDYVWCLSNACMDIHACTYVQSTHRCTPPCDMDVSSKVWLRNGHPKRPEAELSQNSELHNGRLLIPKRTWNVWFYCIWPKTSSLRPATTYILLSHVLQPRSLVGPYAAISAMSSHAAQKAVTSHRVSMHWQTGILPL